MREDVHVHVHVHGALVGHLRVYACVKMGMCACVHVCMCACAWAHGHGHGHVDVHVYMGMGVCACVHVQVYMGMGVCACACMHTHRDQHLLCGREGWHRRALRLARAWPLQRRPTASAPPLPSPFVHMCMGV